MTDFLKNLLFVVAVAGSAVVVARWILPVALRLVLDLLEDIVAATAAVLLLPEYLLSRTVRARGGSPPQLAYEYGALVAGCARHVQLVLRRICRGLVVLGRTLPPAAVAAITVVVHILLLLR